MTRSVRLLKILYGLGNTTSVATVYKHDTALALTTTQEQEIVIPCNVSPGVFATFVWDNDFNKETVSGKGTTHVANGIIVQNGNVSLRQRVTVSKKQRTMTAPQTNIIPYVNREKGTISLCNQSSDISLEERRHADKQDRARNTDFLYVLAKKLASEKVENIPGWRGFNTEVYKEVPTISNIGYLTVIDAPVTDMATVNTILHHSISICERLQLPEIVLVFDEAIYCKAQMIRWKDEDPKRRLVIRLGDSHIVMSFCSAVAKIYKDAGWQVSIDILFLPNDSIFVTSTV